MHLIFSHFSAQPRPFCRISEGLEQAEKNLGQKIGRTSRKAIKKRLPENTRNRIITTIFWRRHPDSNRGIKVLQTLALPLGYGAKYTKKWLGTESNRRHEDFQSSALPTELPSQTFLCKTRSNIQQSSLVCQRKNVSVRFY